MAAAEGTSEAERRQLLELATVALLGSDRKFTPIEVCEQAGVDHDTADRLWRAMGFPDVPDDEVAFTERDIVALKAAIALQRTGLLDEEAVAAQTRVMSQSLATIAAAHLEMPGERNVDRLTSFVQELLPALDDLLVYLYRRHLLAAVEGTLLLGRDDEDVNPTLAVGFADLVGFTRLANEIEEDELSRLVEGFAQATADVVAEEAGRVVKMIGDEVMFTSPNPAAAARTALRLVGEVGDHDGLPPLRAGVAAGPVILRHGDVFGAPVNLAHRLVDAVRPGHVLVDEAVAGGLSAQDGELQRVHSIRRLRGFERVRAFVLHPPPPPAEAAS